MQIFSYKKAKSLHCRFAKHLFELEKDHGKNWYMVVRNDAGEYACDGYISESQDYTAKQAMIEACKGAMIEPPKQWNIE